MNTRINKVRSTNKVVKEKIQAHIIERLDPDYANCPLSNRLERVVDGFKDWLGNTRYPSQFMAFESYLQCIPSTLDAEFATCYQERALNEWMGAPNYERTADRIEDVYYALIYREFRKLCELNNVQF